MARPKKTVGLESIKQASDNKLNKLSSNLLDEKMKTEKSLEPDPWTGKQRPKRSIKGNSE
jgi:hypothetical protein